MGLTLQLPIGEKRDFHGTGETHLSPFVYLSQVFGERFEPHLNLGVDFNTNDVDRSSFLYAVGLGVLVFPQLGVVVDILGRSEFSRFLSPRDQQQPSLPGNMLDRTWNTCTTDAPCRAVANAPAFVLAERIKRNDIIDFTFGVRYLIGSKGSVFFGGVVPLNSDGFRADFVPSGGIEYTF